MLDLNEISGHVKDGSSFHVPRALWRILPESIRGEHPGSIDLPMWNLFGYDFQLTKYMVLELVVVVLILLIFIPLARRIRHGGPPRGRLWNFFEVLLLFIRDEVARPSIGKKSADPFMPYLWTVFFFILFCNLLGMVPWAGSPTGALAVTAVLALMTFGTVAGTGMARHGVAGFWTGMVPPMELPLVLALFLKPMLFGIEILGLGIKHSVLAVRLLANMFAGHLVLAVIVGFIGVAAQSFLVVQVGVTVGSVGGAVALSVLELFVAFLQAYIFTFLSALFIGMAIHQH